MKLYIYDHCPYCVRPRMIFGLKNVPVENVTLLNDDEETPIGLVGKKLVPILMKEDGTPMGESLDIVRYIDENYGEKILKDDIRPEIQAWCDKVGQYYYRLLHPRCVLLGLEEFATQGAIDYFTEKKSAKIGDFAENMANSAEYIQQLNADLLSLDALIQSPQALNAQLSYEDIILFPMLRNLTCVKGLVFPEKVKAYVDTMAQNTHIPLFWHNQR